MKNVIRILALSLAVLAAPAFAQLSESNSQSRGEATNAGVNNATTIHTAPNSPFTYGELNQKFHTNQANSAPAVIGNVSGCGAIEGWSASVAVANGGKSGAVELPVCLLLALSDRIGRLSTNIDGTFDWKSVMQLEAWCGVELYKKAIESSGRYTCSATREAQARAAERPQAILEGRVQVSAKPMPLLP